MSVTAFISTISTTVTLLIGIILFARQIRDRQMEQVSKVAVWLHTMEHKGKKDIILMLNNDSPQPTYNVMLYVRIGESKDPHTGVEMRSSYNVLEPGFKKALPNFGLHDVSVTHEDDDDHWSFEKEQRFYRAFSFELAITDVSGRRWIRNERGSIKRFHSWKRSVRHEFGS